MMSTMNRAPRVAFAPSSHSVMPQEKTAADGPTPNDLAGVISLYVEVPKASLPEHFETSLEDLGLDSIGAVQLASQLFTLYHLEIHPDELFKSSTSVLSSYVSADSSQKAPESLLQLNSHPFPIESTGVQEATESGGAAISLPMGKPITPNLLEAISQQTRIPSDQLHESLKLSELGLDPFSFVELIKRLEQSGVICLGDIQPEYSWTIGELATFQSNKFEEKEKPSLNHSDRRSAHLAHKVTPELAFTSIGSDGATRRAPFRNPLSILAQSDAMYEDAARKNGFAHHWEKAGPLENDITLAFINEALIALGVDLSEYPHGVDIPDIPHIPKYRRLVKRIWDILESRYIVMQRGGKILRGSDRVPPESSAALCQSLRADYPSYECEARLLELVGPALADCLSGKTDPIKVLFGSVQSRDTMQEFYSSSPMMATHMQQVVAFFSHLVQRAAPATSPETPIRILEVGAGTGGTTGPLVKMLIGLGANVKYTFTDIGHSFVSKARLRWAGNPLMEFAVYDVEQDAPPEFKGQFDIVLGANVVHATSNRTITCQRLREVLRPGGLLVLSEVTHIIDWYDICFGLLDGWWLADKGKGYAVQQAEVWMDVFDRAGFDSTGHSGGPTEEANTQQLLIACKS